MFQRTIMIILVVVIILGGGFYAYQQLMPEVQPTDNGPVYSTHAVERGTITVGVNTTGELQPSDGGGIRVSEGLRSAGFSGEIILEELLVKEGDHVYKDQVLATLSAKGLGDAMKDIREKIKTEEDMLMRLTNLSRDKIRSIDPSQGVTVRAPISGRIQDLDIEEGKKIEQGQTITRIVDTSRYKINLRLTPGEYTQVKKGDKVNIHFSNFDGVYEGQITKINTNPVPAGTSEDKAQGYVYRVTVEGSNEGLIQPGMKVRVGLKNALGYTNFFTNDAIVESYVTQDRVASSTEGIITEVHVQDMDEVEEGDPIVSMAGSDVQQTIQDKLEKIRSLESDLRNLESVYPMLEIRSTMDGIVAYTEKQAGQAVSPGDWLGYLYTTSNMGMFTEIDDIDVIYVTQGAKVEVTVDAVPGEVFEGTVRDVSTRGNSSRDGISKFHVFINVVGGPQLRPGMQAKGYIDAGSAEDVLLVPIEAIFQEDNKNKVEILKENGETEVITVELGLMNDRFAEVKEGLNEGDLVVTGSSRDLLPSQEKENSGNNTILPIQVNEEDPEE